jgi:hypothetical protein
MSVTEKNLKKYEEAIYIRRMAKRIIHLGESIFI